MKSMMYKYGLWKPTISNIQKLDNIKLLLEIFHNHSEIEIRDEAEKKLNSLNISQSTIKDIIKNCKDVGNKREIIVVFADQKLKSEFALNKNETEYIRQGAIFKLKDQTVLKQIALDSNDEYPVRSAAILNITDQFFLAKLALENENDRIRVSAAGQVKDQDLIIDILRKEKILQTVRVRIVKNLEDLHLLKALAKNDPNSLLQSVAERRLEELEEK